MRIQEKSIHGEWSSRWIFILAAAGAAVGLGNIWKFPYITGQNGGGAFVLVYLLCVVILGIPVMIAEIMLGRHGRQNPVNTVKSTALESQRSSRWLWLGVLGLLAGFLILTYYSVIAGWALDYVFLAATGHFDHASPDYVQYLFRELIDHPERLIVWHSIIMLSTVIVIVGGVQKGIERAVRFMFPTMVALLLVLVGYALESGAFTAGVEFLFKPDFSKLTANGILIALGHALFTLSIGMGSIMAYGAYLPRRASIIQSTLFIAGADTVIALLAGLVIFPIVFANGLEPASGPGLIFQTIPIAFGRMPYGHFFAVLFFIMLVFAAFTSAISLLEPTVAWLMEHFRLKRTVATISAGFIIWCLGFGTIFSFNLGKNVTFFNKTFFEILDYLTANIMLPLCALGIALFVGWRVNKQVVAQELDLPHEHWLFNSWHWLVRYVTPLAIIAVFLNVLGILKF